MEQQPSQTICTHTVSTLLSCEEDVRTFHTLLKGLSGSIKDGYLKTRLKLACNSAPSESNVPFHIKWYGLYRCCTGTYVPGCDVDDFSIPLSKYQTISGHGWCSSLNKAGGVGLLKCYRLFRCQNVAVAPLKVEQKMWYIWMWYIGSTL